MVYFIILVMFFLFLIVLYNAGLTQWTIDEKLERRERKPNRESQFVVGLHVS